MKVNQSKQRQNHLEFYKEQGIAPVSYNLSNLSDHFDRRRSLYDKLGVTKLAIRGSHILEIAAGTGHNSLYIATCCEPKTFTLLEPNPVALEHINDTYSKFKSNSKTPTLISKRIEEFNAEMNYDIVICENWLGNNDYEIDLLRKTSSLLTVGGLLLVTTVSPIGFVPNLLRRHLSNIIADVTLPFLKRSEIIEEAFASHLATMGSMTRNVTDWVHDNMLNPAYFGICLSIPEAIDSLGDCYEIFATYPYISEDWRWFKSLYGENRKINSHFLDQYWFKCHNYLDAEVAPSVGNIAANKKLEETAKKILVNICDYEDSLLNSISKNKHHKKIISNLGKFIDLVPHSNKNSVKGLREVAALLNNGDKISASSIASMKYFKRLFGRETSYVSFQRVK